MYAFKKFDTAKIVVQIIISFNLSNSQDNITPRVYINEFLSSNSSVNLDSDFYSFCDWIEIFNAETFQVDIGQYFLTDDLSDPFKFKLPDTLKINPNNHILVWADNKNYLPGETISFSEDTNKVAIDCHSNFKLNKDGELIALFDTNGILIDSITFQKQLTNISYGRKPDGAPDWFYFDRPTPNSANDNLNFQDTNRLAVPHASIPSGIYNSSQSINLFLNDSSCIIYYTLDGSIPTLDSPVYSAPIFIDSTSIFRAKAFSNNKISSKVLTNSYIINHSNLSMPLVSISINPEYLWDDQIGIYTIGQNGSSLSGNWGSITAWGVANYWQNWERPTHVEYFNKHGQLQFESEMGIKMHGGFSRTYPQKSMSLHCRPKYGLEQIEYQIFPDKPIENFSSFLLRNSGNDNIAYSESGTMMRDGLVSTLISTSTDIDRQSYKPSVVYINGEYWGIYNIRERTNKDFIDINHNLDNLDLDILGYKYDVSYIIEGSSDSYDDLFNYILSNDITQNSTYSYVNSLIDINQLIDYIITEIFFGVTDWPQNNIKLWKPILSGKWRWILYDTDSGFFHRPEIDNFISRVFDNEENFTNDWKIFPKLIDNSDFKNEFIQRFASHINITFSSEKVLSSIDSLKSNLEPEIEKHIEIWEARDSINIKVDSYDKWLSNVEVLRNFANARSSIILNDIIEFFNLDTTINVTFSLSDSNAGYITLNDVRILDYPDTCFLFKNIPIRINAVAKNGFQFTNWTNDLNQLIVSDSSTFIFEQDINMIANFEQVVLDTPNILINEFLSGSETCCGSDIFNGNNEDFVELYNNGEEYINIRGWGFSDMDGLISTTAPDTSIAPGEFLVLWYTGDNNGFPEINEKLSKNGETIYVADENGNTIISHDFISQENDISYGRNPDGSQIWEHFINPTPGFSNSNLVNVKDNLNVPNAYSLKQNIPNPFNPITSLEYNLPENGLVNITIYDMMGRTVKTLVNRLQTAGFKSVQWDATNDRDEPVSAGLYLYTIHVGQFRQTKKMVLLK